MGQDWLLNPLFFRQMKAACNQPGTEKFSSLGRCLKCQLRWRVRPCLGGGWCFKAAVFLCWCSETNSFLTSHTHTIEKWTCKKGLLQKLSETSLFSLQSFCVNFLMVWFVQSYTPGVLLWVLASNKAKLIVNHCILTFHFETASLPESFKRQSAEYW